METINYKPKNPRISNGFIFKKGVIIYDWFDNKGNYRGSSPLK